MSKLSPVSFSDLVRKLKTLDFEGPFGGGKQTDSGVRPGWTGRSGLARECKLNKLFAYLWTSRFFTWLYKTFDPNKDLVHNAGRVFDAEEIIAGVKAIFSGNERLARQASIYLCHKYSGAKLREIGHLFDMRETAISEASRRFSLKMGNDEKVLNLVRMIEGMLKI